MAIDVFLQLDGIRGESSDQPIKAGSNARGWTGLLPNRDQHLLLRRVAILRGVASYAVLRLERPPTSPRHSSCSTVPWEK